MKAIDAQGGLKPEAAEKLLLLQGRVLKNIEKELEAITGRGSGKGTYKSRTAAFVEGYELIVCIGADSKRLHGDSAEAVGRAEAITIEAKYNVQKVHRYKDAEVVKVPVSLKKLVGQHFIGCPTIRVVELHDGVKEIGYVRSNLIPVPPAELNKLTLSRTHAERLRRLDQPRRDNHPDQRDEAAREFIQGLHRAQDRGAARRRDGHR